MDVIIAAGVESMTRVPIGLARTLPAEHGFGQPKSPRMEKRYPGIVFSQFDGAEAIARKHGFSRSELDAFALTSHEKAGRATQSGMFAQEIVPVEVTDADGQISSHDKDEGIRYDTTLEAIGKVKTVTEEGRISAANASQICDGAAGLLLVSGDALQKLNLLPLARIHQMTVMGGDPVIMLETPIAATRRALERAGMKLDDIDLYEVNEAFASVPLAWVKELKADPAKLNVNGGAIALGHPLGASGARLMTTLVYALKARWKRWGLQTMCEGGGLANVTIIETI
jgi:acetyl-CoA C-acetyltransferase